MTRTLVPYLVVKGAADAIDFYKTAFGAVELFRMIDPGDNRIGHAELLIDASRMMVADEYPDFGAVSPDTIGGTAVTLYVSSTSVDVEADRAVAAGAITLRAPKDQSYGERTCTLMDPFGHRWILSQTISSLSPADMQAGWDAETSA